MSSNLIRLVLQELAESEGLKFFGIVPLKYDRDIMHFNQWLAEKRHAGMGFLEKNKIFRYHPGSLLPGARVAIIFGFPYAQGDTWPRHGETFEGPSRVAQYGRFKDYHRLMKAKLERVMESLNNQIATSASYRILVDSAPVLERALAVQSAEGFIGKNTCFIHPEQGSFFLLSEVLTELDLPVDVKTQVAPDKRSAEGGCGKCNRCQVKCPTGALDIEYQIDANLCLSYWTIEHRGTIPERFWPWLKYYYFGCDICQLVCPYNERSRYSLPVTTSVREFPPLYEVATMSQANYEEFFGGTPLTRAKRNGLRRNALIAMTVTENSRLDEALGLARKDNESPIKETLEQIDLWRGQKTASD
jgi:epoxyqueuosine reductase